MNQPLGVALVSSFAFLMAFQQVYLAHLVQTVNPMFVICAAFTIATLFFWILEWRRFKTYLRDLRKDVRPLLLLNISGALSWGAFFYSLKSLEPAVAATIATAVVPIFMLLVMLLTRQWAKIKSAEVVAAFGVAAALVFLGYTTVAGKSSLTGLNLGGAKLGLLSAVIAGITSVGIIYYSKKLNTEGWNARQVMSFRFFVLIVLSFLMLPKGLEFYSLLRQHFMEVLVISVFMVILPLFLFQLGVAHCSPMTVSLIMSIMPALTFFLQSFDARLTLSTFSLIGIIACVAFSVFGVVARLRGV